MDTMMDNMEITLVGRDDTSLLKNHNIRVYYDLKKELLEKKHVLLETCPGSGKSYITCQLALNMKWSMVVVVPTLAILMQWEQLKVKYNTNTTLLTYHTLSNMDSDEVDSLFEHTDAVVLDEAHHILADKWSENILYIRDCMDKYILGLTADCIRWSDNCKDVADEFFASKVIGYTVDEFYSAGLAEPFMYICGVYSKALMKKSVINEFNGMLENELVGKLMNSIDNVKEVNDILIKYSNKLPMKKIIVFVESADDLEDSRKFIEILDCDILTIYSGYKKKRNEKTLKRFIESNDRCAMICIDMLNEGVHIDGVDTVIMLRRTYVPNLYIQQIGRIISVGAKAGTAVFDFVCNHMSMQGIHKFDFNSGMGISSVKLKGLSSQIIVDDYTADISQILARLSELKGDPYWKDWEDSVLYENYEEHGAVYCQELLPHRTLSAVQFRGASLGLKYRPLPENADTLIRENWRFHDRHKRLTTLMPNASWATIWNRAINSLGLDAARVDIWFPEEDAILLKKYGKCSKAEIAEELNKLPCNINRGMVRLARNLYGRYKKIKPDNTMVIWPDEDIKTLRENFPKIGCAVKSMLTISRTDNAIRGKAHNEGLCYTGYTTDDINTELIKNAYEAHGRNLDEYPDELKIYSNTLLISKLNELGLNKNIKWDYNKLAELYSMHGNDMEFYKKEFPNRTEVAIVAALTIAKRILSDNGKLSNDRAYGQWNYEECKKLYLKHGHDVAFFKKKYPSRTTGSIRYMLGKVKKMVEQEQNKE